MKRFNTIIFISLLLFAAMLSGCGQTRVNDKISVVCTIFPQYDWVRQIVGDKAGNMELTLLLNKKIDLHSYQPSVADIAKIAASDLFIYVGGESDAWVKDALKTAINKNMKVLNLMDILGDAAKNEEFVEGMTPEEEEGENDEPAYDEHVWLSLKNARIFCSAIAEALSALDADNAKEYTDNLNTYIGKLSALDTEYRAVVNGASIKTLLFSDRFPFRYFVDDYGLNYYAAFAGCSAETEASFETIIFLAKKVDELKLNTVMVTESANQSIAKTIIGNTAAKNQKILVLDAMQSVTADDVRNGATYLSVMESNLNILKEALK